jgi:hypothetical protein
LSGVNHKPAENENARGHDHEEIAIAVQKAMNDASGSKMDSSHPRPQVLLYPTFSPGAVHRPGEDDLVVEPWHYSTVAISQKKGSYYSRK